MTAVALLPLVVLLIATVVALVGRDHATVAAALAKPLLAMPLAALVLTGAWHMRLGMQVIIEDYTRGATRMLLLLINTLWAIATVAISLYALLKLGGWI
jgi:succinate dehydrogenase / fumarate reductase membrane anchor subunit